MVFNIHNGSYHRPRCSERSICSPWWLVSYRESFWSEVANPSTRSGKRNMSHCVIMASSLTTPVYMWVPPHLHTHTQTFAPSFAISFPLGFMGLLHHCLYSRVLLEVFNAGLFSTAEHDSLDAITFATIAVGNWIATTYAHDVNRDLLLCVT